MPIFESEAMKPEVFLKSNKNEIITRWFDHVRKTYPGNTAQFLKKENNDFANPVGGTIAKSLEAVFNGLLNAVEKKQLESFVEPLKRIRAVQSFSASEAVSFVFFLKKIIRKLWEKQVSNEKKSAKLLPFESKIDELALISFDVYAKCREKIYDIKAEELKRNIYKALRRAGLVAEIP